MNSWKIILPTAVIFGAGLLAGGVAINRIDRCNGVTSRSVVPTAANGATTGMIRPQPMGMDQRRIEFIRTVSSNLNLTAEQRVCVDTTLRESQECIEKLWKEFKPKTSEVLTTCQAKILADLTPEQREQFKEMMKRPARDAKQATPSNVLSEKPQPNQ